MGNLTIPACLSLLDSKMLSGLPIMLVLIFEIT